MFGLLFVMVLEICPYLLQPMSRYWLTNNFIRTALIVRIASFLSSAA